MLNGCLKHHVMFHMVRWNKITLLSPHCNSRTLWAKKNPVKQPGLLVARWLEHSTGNGRHEFDSWLKLWNGFWLFHHCHATITYKLNNILHFYRVKKFQSTFQMNPLVKEKGKFPMPPEEILVTFCYVQSMKFANVSVSKALVSLCVCSWHPHCMHYMMNNSDTKVMSLEAACNMIMMANTSNTLHLHPPGVVQQVLPVVLWGAVLFRILLSQIQPPFSGCDTLVQVSVHRRVQTPQFFPYQTHVGEVTCVILQDLLSDLFL